MPTHPHKPLNNQQYQNKRARERWEDRMRQYNAPTRPRASNRVFARYLARLMLRSAVLGALAAFLVTGFRAEDYTVVGLATFGLYGWMRWCLEK